MGRLYKLMSIQLVLKTKVTNCLVTENCDVFLSKFGNVCLIGFVCDCGDQMWNKLEPLNDGTFSSYEKQQQKYYWHDIFLFRVIVRVGTSAHDTVRFPLLIGCIY